MSKHVWDRDQLTLKGLARLYTLYHLARESGRFMCRAHAKAWTVWKYEREQQGSHASSWGVPVYLARVTYQGKSSAWAGYRKYVPWFDRQYARARKCRGRQIEWLLRSQARSCYYGETSWQEHYERRVRENHWNPGEYGYYRFAGNNWLWEDFDWPDSSSIWFLRNHEDLYWVARTWPMVLALADPLLKGLAVVGTYYDPETDENLLLVWAVSSDGPCLAWESALYFNREYARREGEARLRAIVDKVEACFPEDFIEKAITRRPIDLGD